MASQSNILFLITDQQRVDTLGCYGNPICRTPNIDRLAAQGTRFDQAYTPTAICTPARASLITGVMPFEHKLLANFERNVGYNTELPADTISFAHHLRGAGYNVGTVGKWHIGMDRGPVDFGFDGIHYPGWGEPVQHPDYLHYLDEHGFPPSVYATRSAAPFPMDSRVTPSPGFTTDPWRRLSLTSWPRAPSKRSNAMPPGMPPSSWPASGLGHICPTTFLPNTPSSMIASTLFCPSAWPKPLSTSPRCSVTTRHIGPSIASPPINGKT